MPQYVLGERIGKGAFAKVYKAIELQTAQTVAIKEMVLSEMSSVESIMREIELLKDLAHPNIVQYLGYYQEAQTFRIVLEYCESGSLAVILRKFGLIPESLCSIYMSQVLQGLAYLHKQGTIHRDIKGANILTTKDGVAKLADFGVATDALGSDGPQVVGTPHWMAPEIIQLQEPTTACDIWSLGCTVIELSTGKPPYHNLSAMATMYSMVNDDMPPIPQELSPVCRDFVQLCFQKDPQLRSTAAQLAQHPWIYKAAPRVDDALKTIAKYNDETRKERLSVPSRLDLRDAYKAAAPAPPTVASGALAGPALPPRSMSAFIEQDDGFDDLAEELELAAPQYVSPQKSPKRKVTPQKDPFQGIAELMDEEPNLRLKGIHEELAKLLALLRGRHEPALAADCYMRLCELVNAEPSIKRSLLQSRVLAQSIRAATTGSPRLVEAVLDFSYLMLKGEENACDSFCLNNGLALLLGQFSLQPAQCLLVLREILTNYAPGAVLAVCQGSFVHHLSRMLVVPNLTAICSECVALIFTRFGSRRRAELWYSFQQADLLNNIIEAMDPVDGKKKRKLELGSQCMDRLYGLLAAFSKLPPDEVGKFVTKHDLRKLMRVYRYLSTTSEYRTSILRFYKSVSTVPEVLEAMDAGELGPYFVKILKECYRGTSQTQAGHLKASCLLPLFHNYCRLSSHRQTRLVRAGLMPLLIATSTWEPDLKEFSVPIVCAMAHNTECWRALRASSGLEFLIGLVLEQGWETTAVAAVTAWLTREHSEELVDQFIEMGGINALSETLKKQDPEVFTSVITSLSTLVTLPQVCQRLPSRTLFSILRKHLRHEMAATALVRVLMVVREVLVLQKCVEELHETGLWREIKGKTDMPVMCMRLAEEIERVSEQPQTPPLDAQHAPSL